MAKVVKSEVRWIEFLLKLTPNLGEGIRPRLPILSRLTVNTRLQSIVEPDYPSQLEYFGGTLAERHGAQAVVLCV